MILINKLKLKTFFFGETISNIIYKTFKLATTVQKQKNDTVILHSVMSFTDKKMNKEVFIALTHNKYNVNLPGTKSFISPILVSSKATRSEEKILSDVNSINFCLKCKQIMFYYYLNYKFISCYNQELLLTNNTYSNRILYHSDPNILMSNPHLKSNYKNFSKIEYKTPEQFYSNFCVNIDILNNKPVDAYFSILQNSIQNEHMNYKF